MLRRRPRRPFSLALVVVLAAGCASDSDASDPDPTVSSVSDTDETTSDDTVATTPDDPTEESNADDTNADDTNADDTIADDTTPEDTAPPTTAAPTTTAAADPTTTAPPTTVEEPIAVQELVLAADGIGSARFGADPDGVITYVSSILGGATDDTEWVDPFTFADCSFANEARRVDWGVLSLIFTDASPYANGRQHFIGWEYGIVGGIGDEPQGLRTRGGVTLGSRVVDLLAEFPQTSIIEGDDELAIPASYYLNDEFNGLLTGTADTDVVTVMTGGVGCFG